jgi:hypothetical protein
MKNIYRLYVPFTAVAVLMTALTTTERLTAQETFAPLLTKDTVFFAHVDLRKVDVDVVKAETKKLAAALMETLAFDAKSQRATLRDLDAELEKWDAIIRPIFDTITKELGIQEIAVIIDYQFLEFECLDGPVIVVMPWKGKTDADLQTLLTFLVPETMSEGFKEDHVPIGDFLFFAPNLAKCKDELKQWFKAAADNGSPVLQALQTLKKSDEVKIVAVPPKALRQMAEETKWTDMLVDEPIQIFNLRIFALEKVKWIAVSLPVSELLTGTAKEWRLATVKMSNVAGAKKLRELMEEAIDAGIAAAKKAEPETPPLVFEFTKGLMRTWLPEVEGDTLILQWKGSNAAFFGAAAVGSFLFLGVIIQLMGGPGDVIHNPHMEEPIYFPKDER